MSPHDKTSRSARSIKAVNSASNVKNFHGSLTAVVRAQNDISKTANITDSIFNRT